jgi:hypothetical protein
MTTILRWPPLKATHHEIYTDQFTWLDETERERMINEVKRIASDYIALAPRSANVLRGLYTMQEVAGYHLSMGMDIRNHYSLWHTSELTKRWRENPYSHDIRFGIDFSVDNPDAISTLILKEAWLQLKSQP